MGQVDWVVNAMWSCWVASFGLRQFTDPAILRSRQRRRRSFGQESGGDVADHVEWHASIGVGWARHRQVSSRPPRLCHIGPELCWRGGRIRCSKLRSPRRPTTSAMARLDAVLVQRYQPSTAAATYLCCAEGKLQRRQSGWRATRSECDDCRCSTCEASSTAHPCGYRSA